MILLVHDIPRTIVTAPLEHNPFTDAVVDMSVGRKIALNMAINAAQGDQNACKEVRDTIDGKPAQSVNVGGPEGNPDRLIKSEVPEQEKHDFAGAGEGGGRLGITKSQ